MSLFLLNMLPLLPLDGGHIFGAVIEWVRRGWAKLRGKKDPGPFDVAKLMPVAYVVALLFIGLTALTLVADLVNPVKTVRLSAACRANECHSCRQPPGTTELARCPGGCRLNESE